jgi:hypothetical protein
MRNMKNILTKVLLPAILVFGPMILFAQDVDLIIEKHIDAHGGMENWNKIESLKITGDFTSFSEIKPFEEVKAKGGKFYSRHHKGQHQVIEGCDGEFFWVDDPWFELGFPHEANAAEEYVIRQKAEFCTPFFDYRKRGYEVVYEGIENIEGVDAHKLVLSRENGHRETWYLDTATYLETSSLSRWADFAAPAMQQVFYDDFRKVGDVVVPYYIERVFSIRHRVVEIDHIDINVNPDPSLFELPIGPEMKKLQFMEGDWVVAHETRGRSGELQPADSTISAIQFLRNKNLMQEKISYSDYFPQRRINRWSYNTERNHYLMTVFNSFTSNMDIFTGQFDGDTLTMDNLDIKFGDEPLSRLTRYKIVKIGGDQIKVEIMESQDGGENWAILKRFTYLRKQK